MLNAPPAQTSWLRALHSGFHSSTRSFSARSGVAHVSIIHVDELTVHFGFLGEKIHYQQVHIAIFEHVRQLLVEKPELLIVCIVCNLNHKHRQSPLALYSFKGQFLCQQGRHWASQLLQPIQMFVNEFFFSFSLLAFTGILMVLGLVLLIDAGRRLALEIFKPIRTKPAVVVGIVPQKPNKKVVTLEPAA
jgi:hypothetical protein